MLTGALKIVDWERDAYVHYEKAFPEEGHWISRPQNGILWQRVFFEWLDRFLQP